MKPNKDGSAKLMIRQSSDGDFLLEGNSYDKFSPCRNLNFDIFEQDNKSAFTRKKNAIAKKLIEFNTLHKMNVLKAVRDAFNDDSIKFPTKALTTKFDCSNDIILKARKLLGIPPKGKVSYTCKKCGYTTHDKQNMRKHKNRKRPCTPNDWKKIKGKRKKKR